MNAIEIKEKRTLLKLTQKELAKLIGVSTQTINGYENGKEIPSTKHQILDLVLNNNESNILRESNSMYQKNDTYHEKLIEIKEKIKAREDLIADLEKNKIRNSSQIEHQKEIISILKIRLNLFLSSNKELQEDLEILRILDQKK